MNRLRTEKMHTGGKMLVVALVAAFLFASGCSKNDATGEQKTPGVAQKAETGKKEAPPQGIVKLTPEGVKAAGIEVRKVAATAPSELISATAVLELNGDRVARVNPRASGRAVNVDASQGDRVRSGQVLARIDSVDMDQAWSEYLKASARLKLSAGNVKREETLFQKKVSPEKDLLKARQEFGEAEADVLLAKEKFRLLGVDVRHVETDTNGTDHIHPLIPVCAPVSGVVIEKTVTKGEMVGPDKTLFTVADLSTLWLMVDIYERDLIRVKTGTQVKLSVSAYPGKEFKGHISYLGDLMDEKTRTIKARVTIDNAGNLLRPGMFASVSMEGLKSGEKIIAVPVDAVMEGGTRYVFLAVGPDTFKKTEVTVGRDIGTMVEISQGLAEGDTVVVKGAFTLKSELNKSELVEE